MNDGWADPETNIKQVQSKVKICIYLRLTEEFSLTCNLYKNYLDSYIKYLPALLLGYLNESWLSVC